MRRRNFLAASTSTALFSLAGCLSIGQDSSSLGPPTEEMDADGMEKHLIFTRDATEQAIITINQRGKPQSLNHQIPFRFHIWHRDGLSIDRVYYKLRSPPHSTGVPAQVFLQVPDGGPWPAFDLRKEDNLWTVISVDEIGALGDGSLTLDLILDPVSDPADELAVRAEVDFSERGIIDQHYRATAHTNFDILTGDQKQQGDLA